MIALSIGAASAPARAESQVWTSLAAQGRLDDTGPAGWLDLHLRRRGDSTLLIVRPAIGYAITKSFLVHAGYAYVPAFSDEGDDRVEHRIWQQLLGNITASPAVKLQARLRVEQRFGPAEGIAHRVRALARAQWAPSSTYPLQVVVWDELFVQLDDESWGPIAGYDQNRGFVGLGADTQLRGVRVEAGYLNVVGRARTDHAVSVNLVLNVMP